MRIRSFIAISIVSLVAGYSLAILQLRIAGPSPLESNEGKSPNWETGNVKSLYELDEVHANRRDLDGRSITVAGAVLMHDGRPFLVPDDDVALLKDFPGEGRYSLSLPTWRFQSIQGVTPNIAVTGRFHKLDDVVGFDILAPIDSISCELPPRGLKHDAMIDDEEQKIIEAEQDAALNVQE